MNERIKELAEQATLYADEKSGAFRGEIFMRCFTEKFAELVRQEEREKCAKLCEDINKTFGIEFEAVNRCAAAIRGRTE